MTTNNSLTRLDRLKIMRSAIEDCKYEHPEMNWGDMLQRAEDMVREEQHRLGYEAVYPIVDGCSQDGRLRRAIRELPYLRRYHHRSRSRMEIHHITHITMTDEQKQLTRQRIGQRIADLRRQRGMTQEYLATAAGLHRPHLVRIEHGQYAVTLETVQAIAEVFGMTVDIV